MSEPVWTTDFRNGFRILKKNGEYVICRSYWTTSSEDGTVTAEEVQAMCDFLNSGDPTPASKKKGRYRIRMYIPCRRYPLPPSIPSPQVSYIIQERRFFGWDDMEINIPTLEEAKAILKTILELDRVY